MPPEKKRTLTDAVLALKDAGHDFFTHRDTIPLEEAEMDEAGVWQRKPTNKELEDAVVEGAEDSKLWRKLVITGVSADRAKIDDKPVDLVNSPPHYGVFVGSTSVECIDVIRALGLTENYYRASAFKYLWRADKKGDKLKDLQKAKRFIEFEIEEVMNAAKVRKDNK